MSQQTSAITAQNTKVKYLPAEELSIFCEQVSLILSSGVSLFDGIEALAQNYQGTSVEPIFKRIAESVMQSGSLYTALKGERIFPSYLVEMVQVGENTGKLDQVMSDLSDYYLRESRIRRSVQNAVAYPLGLLLMMAVVIMVLVMKVLPIFDQVYKSLGSELPDNAMGLMNFGMGVGNVVLIIVAALIIGILAVVVMLNTRFKQQVADIVGRVFPPLRRIYNCISAERFASNMALMLQSGYPLESALPLMANVFDDPISKEKVVKCEALVNQGSPFPEAIAETQLFDKLHNKMIQMGYMSGKTDSVMSKLSYIYEEELDNDISKVVAMIEPSMVAMLSIIIGAILLSVMLPMVSIMSSIL